MTTDVHSSARLTTSSAVALAGSGALLATGGLLHPKGPLVFQLDDAPWIPAHVAILGAFVLLTVALLRISATRPPSPMRTAGRIAAAGAGLAVVESVPHLLAFADAHAAQHGDGPTPWVDLHLSLGLVSNAVMAVSLVVLALLAAPSRALGTGRGAVALVAVGGIAFAVAAPLVVATGVGAFEVLFSGSVLIGVWLVLAGVRLARR